MITRTKLSIQPINEDNKIKIIITEDRYQEKIDFRLHNLFEDRDEYNLNYIIDEIFSYLSPQKVRAKFDYKRISCDEQTTSIYTMPNNFEDICNFLLALTRFINSNNPLLDERITIRNFAYSSIHYKIISMVLIDMIGLPNPDYQQTFQYLKEIVKKRSHQVAEYLPITIESRYQALFDLDINILFDQITATEKKDEVLFNLKQKTQHGTFKLALANIEALAKYKFFESYLGSLQYVPLWVSEEVSTAWPILRNGNFTLRAEIITFQLQRDNEGSFKNLHNLFRKLSLNVEYENNVFRFDKPSSNKLISFGLHINERYKNLNAQEKHRERLFAFIKEQDAVRNITQPLSP